MSNVTIRIDGKAVRVSAESTILEAAAKAGIRIPSLCYLKDQSIKANCRVCMVEVKGFRTLVPACATKVAGDMEVVTNSEAVVAARKMSLHLILSHHPIDCQSCVRLNNSYIEDLDPDVCSSCFYCDCNRDGDCELQSLAAEYEINYLKFSWQHREEPLDQSTASIIRDPNKCINCRRCISACGEIQNIHVWGVTGRGSDSRVQTTFGLPLSETACVECGQCLRSCPVASLQETEEFDALADAAADKNKSVQVYIEPYFLNRYLELAHLAPDRYGNKNLIAGLHRLGVDYVVKNGSVEDAVKTALNAELSKHIGSKPLISAVCPASVRLVEQDFPELIDQLSGVLSSQQWFGQNAGGADCYSVSLSRCSARKMEANRSQYVSQVISPRELNRLFVRSGVDLAKLPPKDFDAAPGEQVTSIKTPQVSGITVSEIVIDGKCFKAASACGLRAARELLEQVAAGNTTYDYIQLQACPDGCVSTNAWLASPS